MAAEGFTLFRGRFRSLRLRSYLVVISVLILPLVFVAMSNWQDSGTANRMLTNVSEGSAEIATALGQTDTPGSEFLDSVEAIARKRELWVRIYDPNGANLIDTNHAMKKSQVARTTDPFFYGPGGLPTLREFDAELGSVLERREIREARRRTTAFDCRTGQGGQRVVCHGVVFIQVPTVGEAGWIIYSQDNSRRAIRALYEFRHEIFKLTVFVLPLALFLAWWLGSRIVSPVQHLRQQVLDKANEAAPRADLDLGREDEFGELTAAFNALLAALEDRNKSNEAFVADLAHEFKNPVAAIRAAAESLQTGQVDETKASRLSGILDDSSKRLDALVTQFLELARAEAGLTRDERERVDLAALARGIVDAIAKDERYKAVALDVQTNGASEVMGVAHGLESVLRNLIENAVSFAAPEGKVDVDVTARNGEVILEISDTGPGIKPEDLPKVFDRFFTTRGARQGTGLGLALVRATVEAHGGTVRARSEPGAGATFEVRLPAV